jgi:short-subunit dehydrogenase
MRGEFADLSGEVCSRVIATNLSGAVNLTRIAMDHIIEAKGNIVFISSIAGLFGLPGASVYCASKMALTGLCESLRLELIPKGVHVGIVYLGFTEHDPEKRILAADGKPVLPDRPAHHTQAQAANRIVRMLKKRKKQLIMTPIGNFGWLVHRLSPRLVERVVLMAKSSNIGLFRRFS